MVEAAGVEPEFHHYYLMIPNSYKSPHHFCTILLLSRVKILPKKLQFFTRLIKIIRGNCANSIAWIHYVIPTGTRRQEGPAGPEPNDASDLGVNIAWKHSEQSRISPALDSNRIRKSRAKSQNTFLMAKKVYSSIPFFPKREDIDYVNNRKRFTARVKGKGNQCWMYKGPIHSTGYGVFYVEGARIYAHRYVMEYLFGSPPVGLETDHLCGIKACVNLFHLEYVPHAENIRRAAEKCINRNGKFWTTKLDIEDVLMIREMSETGIPIPEIANRLDVINIQTVYKVLRGESWGHLLLKKKP